MRRISLSLSLALLQIDFSSSAQFVTGKWLDRIKNGHPFRARLSSIWQCFVLVRRGRPKVRGCASGTCTSRVSVFISYLPACVLPCYRVKWINAAPHAPVAALLNKRIWQSPYLMSTKIVQFPSRHPLYRMHALVLLQAGEQRGSGWILVNGAWMVNSSPPPHLFPVCALLPSLILWLFTSECSCSQSGAPGCPLCSSTPPLLLATYIAVLILSARVFNVLLWAGETESRDTDKPTNIVSGSPRFLP